MQKTQITDKGLSFYNYFKAHSRQTKVIIMQAKQNDKGFSDAEYSTNQYR